MDFAHEDPKKEALAAKDEDLFAMMQLRAQQIREEEEKEGKTDDGEEDDDRSDRSASEEKPGDVIKVSSIQDRKHACAVSSPQVKLHRTV